MNTWVAEREQDRIIALLFNGLYWNTFLQIMKPSNYYQIISAAKHH